MVGRTAHKRVVKGLLTVKGDHLDAIQCTLNVKANADSHCYPIRTLGLNDTHQGARLSLGDVSLEVES